MGVIEALSEEECYLWAILQDESGLDLAEFSFFDESRDDGCFRAWPFQWSWWRCGDELQIDQCSRSVGKSMSIMVRACVFGFIHPGQEMLITAPEGNHLDAITDKIETQLLSTRLISEMLMQGRSSIKHRPFHVNFQNGARIMGRIPQITGRGVKGQHPVWLELDEASDYPDNGWVELTETLNRGIEGAVWRAHGVTRGVRDKFYQYTNDPKSKWTVHRYTSMHRPTWTDSERQQKIDMYGGRDDPDYRRNILGLHGDSMSYLFVLARLMNCADDNKESDYNTEEYQFYRVNDALLAERGVDIVQVLDFPEIHRQKYNTFWVGMDVGFTTSPSEILVFAEETLKPSSDDYKQNKRLGKALPPDNLSRLKLLTRINLQRIGATDQVRAMLRVVDFYRPVALSVDKTGVGLPLFQEVQEKNSSALTIIKGYGFAERILVDFDQSIIVEDGLSNEDLAKEAGIKRYTVDYATDVLRVLVDGKRLWLPWDEDLLGEFQGQTYKMSNTLDQYGRRSYSKGKDHALDAARMAVLGWKQYAIEALMAEQEEVGPVLDLFGI